MWSAYWSEWSSSFRAWSSAYGWVVGWVARGCQAAGVLAVEEQVLLHFMRSSDSVLCT